MNYFTTYAPRLLMVITDVVAYWGLIILGVPWQLACAGVIVACVVSTGFEAET